MNFLFIPTGDYTLTKIILQKNATKKIIKFTTKNAYESFLENTIVSSLINSIELLKL